MLQEGTKAEVEILKARYIKHFSQNLEQDHNSQTAQSQPAASESHLAPVAEGGISAQSDLVPPAADQETPRRFDATASFVIEKLIEHLS